MKNDPEQRERIQETKRKRREFIEKHAKKFKVDESAEEEQNDEEMDDIGSRGLKRKAEDNQETEPTEVMDCMCESPIDVVNIVEEDDMLEEYKADDCMEEKTRNWADMTEEEHAEPKTFYDNLTGKALKHEKVIEARLDEIKALQDMGVWEVVPVAECMRKTQKKPIRGRWVDVNKGDDQMEVYRSRYVAMELKHQYGGATRDGLFVAMPPLEGMRLLLSYVASRQNRKFPHKLMFIDISEAYLHADGRLLRTLYGTRQAARAWEEEYTKTLKGVDFQREKCHPCMFYHPRRDVRVLVHGDDFTVAGNDSELKYVAEVFHNKYQTTVRGILGPDLHDMKAMTILNRIVEWTIAGIQHEADPRHSSKSWDSRMRKGPM